MWKTVGFVVIDPFGDAPPPTTIEFTAWLAVAPGATGVAQARLTTISGVTVLTLGSNATVPTPVVGSTGGQTEAFYYVQLASNTVGETAYLFSAYVVRNV